ncbi:hypothetical protein F2P81_003361 [Scophthalmus maximus]|uniref:Uncharacterized protein n=1 Tax=Scophthalmus maximus TaxID=52904 RepID=A0A6A4TE13_SCOMX|nr:hypothetical protein F2P81_003361 [Scophthalmus maximus]
MFTFRKSEIDSDCLFTINKGHGNNQAAVWELRCFLDVILDDLVKSNYGRRTVTVGLTRRKATNCHCYNFEK